MKIALLIRSLGRGGAERQIVLLAGALRQRGHDVNLLTFYPGGAFSQSADLADVAVTSLEKRGRWDLAGFFLRLVRWLRRHRPDILYCFMPTANLTGLAARAALPGLRLVWGIRASPPQLNHYDTMTGLTHRLEQWLSPWTDLIVANSQAGLAPFRAIRRDAADCVIPNGINTDLFRPNTESGARIRQEWNIAVGQRVVGIVARIDPMKDHACFLSAAAIMSAARTDLRFVVVGTGDPALLETLKQLAATLGISDKLLWVGARDDMPAIYNAIDLLVLSSAFGEGFPNVIGEAMACGTPCVSTDVGDAAALLGDPDLTALCGNPESLARVALAQLDAAGTRADRGDGGHWRQRIVTNFSPSALAAQTESALQAVAGRHHDTLN